MDEQSIGVAFPRVAVDAGVVEEALVSKQIDDLRQLKRSFFTSKCSKNRGAEKSDDAQSQSDAETRPGRMKQQQGGYGNQRGELRHVQYSTDPPATRHRGGDPR
jgi:hypothetical protein